MTFYLKPPRGNINLHQLEKCVNQRLSFYNNLHNLSNLDLTSYDCLIEDSGHDRTGHFIFRIYAHLNSTFRDIFISSECKILKLRLGYYNDSDLKYFTKKLAQHTRDLLTTDDIVGHLHEYLKELLKVCIKMIQKDYIGHFSNHIDCEKYIVKVPFQICPSLLPERFLNVKNGFIEVPCMERKRLYLSLYQRFLHVGLNEMKYSGTVEAILRDTRILTALELIKQYYFTNKSKESCNFSITDIDNESRYFPLCMGNLYGILQRNNRLSHNARFDFSLFLKDIGATMDESMKFWETTYSKQHASCSRCTHSWQENEKKYIYGIRHMYGLEGGRRTYSARSCKNLQEKSLSASDEGGCPFIHFDDENLRRTLKLLLPGCEDQIEVIIYERKENPNESCKLYFENFYAIKNGGSLSVEPFTGPVQYFDCMKRLQDKKKCDEEVASTSYP